MERPRSPMLHIKKSIDTTTASTNTSGGEVELLDEEELNLMAQKANKVSFAVHHISCALFILVACIVILVAGLIIGLGLYFNFDSQSTKYIKELVALDSKTKSALLQDRISQVQRGVDSLVALLTVRAYPQEVFTAEEFATYGVKAFGANASVEYFYSPAVLLLQLNDYTIAVRQAFNTSQFEVKQFNENNSNVEPVPLNRQVYYPILYSYPKSDEMMGLDVFPLDSTVIFNAIQNPNIFAASYLYRVLETGDTIFRLTKAVMLDSSNIKGVVDSIVSRDTLFDALTDDLYWYIVTNANSSMYNESVLYSSLYQPVSLQDPFLQTQTILFGDQTWHMHAIPTSLLLRQQTNASKWFALIGSIIVTLFIMVFVALCCIIVLYMIRTSKITSSRMKLVLVAQNNLKKLIQRIATQEQQSKFILDSIQDCVVIVNTVTGKIKAANRSFQLVYQYEEEDWKDLHIVTVLPDLVQDFFTSTKEEEEEGQLLQQLEQATSMTKAGVQYKVKVAQTAIPSPTEKYTYSLVVIRLLGNDVGLFANKFTNELLVRPSIDTQSIMNETSASIELLQRLKQKSSDFYTMFRQFCKQEFTLDTLDCIEMIEEYKTIANIEQRIKMQQQISTLFFKEKAPRQVNVSGKVLLKVSRKMEQSLGHLDCFDFAEKILLDTLILNSYSRFNEMIAAAALMQQRNSIISTSTTSSFSANNSIDTNGTRNPHQVVEIEDSSGDNI